MFNEIWPNELGYINVPVAKSKLSDIILTTYRVSGKDKTIEVLDDLKELGFDVATTAGISMGVSDMIIPESKGQIVADSRKKIDEVEGQYRKGIITQGERYNKIIDIWTGATDQIQKAHPYVLEKEYCRQFHPAHFLAYRASAASPLHLGQ